LGVVVGEGVGGWGGEGGKGGMKPMADGGFVSKKPALKCC